MNFYNFLKNRAIEEKIEKIVVGAIITNPKNQILLVKRKMDDFMGGIYEIPSGNLEEGESIYETLVRETKEETNLDIKEVKTYINQFDYQSKSGKKCRQFNFEVEVASGEIILTEHDLYKWVALEEIDKEKGISQELKYGLLIYKFNKEQKIYKSTNILH